MVPAAAQIATALHKPAARLLVAGRGLRLLTKVAAPAIASC
jgi:hypothetical protein